MSQPEPIPFVELYVPNHTELPLLRRFYWLVEPTLVYEDAGGIEMY